VEPQPKNRFTAKDAKAAKETQNPNHTFAPLSAGSGTRRENQGHEGKKQRDSSRENKIFKVSNAEAAAAEWDCRRRDLRAGFRDDGKGFES
jgi:hypothetical protein